MDNLENKILYIDDEEVNLLLFNASFSKHYNITTAFSAKAAEQLILENQFKVIISDISMPNETGLEFFKRIRFQNFEPVFIVLTAFVSNALLLEALNQGKIFRYLTKPWKNNEVKHTIDQAIQSFDLHYQNTILDQQIKESERKFHNIFQYSRDSIVIFDKNENILEANDTFLKTVQQDLNSLKDKKITDFLDAHSKVLFLDRLKNLTNNSVFEYDLYITGAEKIVVEANTCSIEYKDGSAMLSIIRDITERKQHEKAIFNAVLQAEEKERSRIAKDLHDGLGPILATLKMYLEWLSEKSRVEDHPDILGLSVSSAGEAITTLKSISNNLSPHLLETFGLASALNSFIERIKKISDIKFNLEINLKERLPAVFEISLYRVITECINNSLKHSSATKINLKLHIAENVLSVNYSDNGKGFDVNTALNGKSGMGLYNMQNRINKLGGKINFQSIENEKTEISIEVIILN
jgi:PAS domain S-box-containing protein